MNYRHFYNNYYGHRHAHLSFLLKKMKSLGKSTIVYLAGDSSLDNKYWLTNKDYNEAINGYEKCLDPPIMKCDISYHLNNLLNYYKDDVCVINCAVEESTIGIRENKLMRQDKFIKDNILS